MSNAPIPSKPGDKITVAILAMANPLRRGSPEGFGLRHLRLRFALGHTAARQPFFGLVTAPGTGTDLQGAREMLTTLKGDDLATLEPAQGNAADLLIELSNITPAVLGGLSGDRVWLDLRAISPREDQLLVQAIQQLPAAK